MTRALATVGLCCGLWCAVAASFTLADKPPRSGNTQKVRISKELAPHSPGQDLRGPAGHVRSSLRPSDHLDDSCQQVERQRGERSDRPQQINRQQDKRQQNRREPNQPESDQRNGARRGDGEHPGGPHAAHLERRFVFDAVRRAGGTLELLPLLFVPEVREELRLDEPTFKDKLDKYMAEMQIRIDENRRQAAAEPKERLAELFHEQLARENNLFEKFLKEMPQAQQDQLVYLFIQARNYRSLSNQLVVAKMEMSPEEAADIRREIDAIREQTMQENRERFRRIFDQGGRREQFENMVRENQRKMDARIEKKLNDAQRAKFAELRGKTSGEPPEWLRNAVDFPFRPNSPPRSEPKETRHK